jgi:hypothetical protein
MSFMFLNCPLIFYLLGNCVNWVIDLFFEIGHRVGQLFELSSIHISIPSVSATTASSPPSFAFWHSRLSHASVSRVQVLASKGLLGSMSNISFDCISCQLGKQPALPFNNSKSIASASSDLIHYDV